MAWFNQDKYQGGGVPKYNNRSWLEGWLANYMPPGYSPSTGTNLQFGNYSPGGWGWSWQPWAGEPGGPVLDMMKFYPASGVRRGRGRNIGEGGTSRRKMPSGYKQQWMNRYNQQQPITPMPEQPAPPQEPGDKLGGQWVWDDLSGQWVWASEPTAPPQPSVDDIYNIQPAPVLDEPAADIWYPQKEEAWY